MTLANVRDLVRHDRSEFALRMGIQKQPAVHADDASRRSEGIEFRAIHDYERHAVVLQLAVQGQIVRDIHEVIIEERVGYGLAAAPD